MKTKELVKLIQRTLYDHYLKSKSPNFENMLKYYQALERFDCISLSVEGDDIICDAKDEPSYTYGLRFYPIKPIELFTLKETKVFSAGTLIIVREIGDISYDYDRCLTLEATRKIKFGEYVEDVCIEDLSFEPGGEPLKIEDIILLYGTLEGVVEN